ncbi:haloacid dehalogenase-like hydrolase domain-containing protein 2 [Multifurca ochricompacta]|uniref:Haloacid dehalogenase-like hydrolase domain-containing protein 2 n=1 Tax=Multifurca ochricompacta TaxID=376703 RepID=A0AAD4QM33_9AGAM|nr:haloacid dehalogenase-like hydrolase domain-containing protein 2 [Multifurca ochricompacta]
MTPRPAIRALLIDLSGTIHVATQPTPGSPQAIHRLRASSIPFRFCSNTSKESTAVLRSKLAEMGIETHDNEVWTSIGAVNSLLRDRGVERPFILASESAAEECRRDIHDNPVLPYDSVVVAFAPTQFDYVALNTAFRVLMNEHNTQRGRPLSNCPFIATHRSRYIGDSDGALSLGPGPFVAALENASGRTAEVVGKPQRKFFELVLSSLASDVQDREGVVAVIGDDVQNDLGGGAVELGFWRVLVRSGKYRDGDENNGGVRPPDEVCDNFASFVESLLNI